MSPTTTSTTVDPIVADIGEGLLENHFGGQSYIFCLMEIVKNCRDWGAKVIRLNTQRGRRVLRIFDNGRGMNQANRNSFFSINRSTGVGRRQSARFGSGTKYMLYSWSTCVDVRTAPEDDPEHVIIFSFTTSDYERMVMNREEIIPMRVKKTAETWPYDFPFGTEITYTLARKPQKSQGEDLAKELSARLPLKFSDAQILFVDDEPLPPKKIVGKPFRYSETHPQLGEFEIEVYQPKKRRAEEALRLTGVEIGEAPISALSRVLGHLDRGVPAIYLLKEVCGVISAEFLSEFANEDRSSISSKIADDPRTQYFLRLLRSLAPKIQAALRIRLKSADASDEKEIEEVVTLFNARYNPDAKLPGLPPGSGGKGLPEDDTEEDPDSPEKPPLTLKVGKEFEPGETIEVKVRLRKGLPYKVSDVNFLLGNTRAHSVQSTAKGLTMIASNNFGRGSITADIPGTLYTASRQYDIVPQRIFRLSITTATAKLGSEFHVMAVNHDKLQGKVKWEHSGAGEIVADGNRVLFKCTSLGDAIIIGRDDQNNTVYGQCDVTIVQEIPKTICIRGVHFVLDFYETDDPEYARPVTLAHGGALHHKLFFNCSAPGYKQALERGALPVFLIQAASLAFPIFKMFELDGEDVEDYGSGDFPALAMDLATDGYAIFREVMTGQNGS